MTAIRPMSVAGVFYPDQPQRLAAEVDRMLAAVSADLPADGAEPVRPKAVIAPHAGYPYSGPAAARVYAPLRSLAGTVTRVVLVGPSHRVPFRGIALTEAEAYATPFGPVPLDRAWMGRLAGLSFVGRLEEAHGPEHALEVHLPFLTRVLGSFGLVPVVCGRVTADQVAEALERLWGGPETLVVISTDLSHYLPYDACQALDAATARAVESLDPSAIGPKEACGHVPLGGLLTLAKRRGMAVHRAALLNSGDTAGSRDRVVGYGAWALVDAMAAGEHTGTDAG